MKILIINTLKSGGILHYTASFAKALFDNNKVKILTSDISEYSFFKLKCSLSPLLYEDTRNIFHKLIRLFWNYCIIFFTALFGRYDTIHFQWPISVKFDSFFIKCLKFFYRKPIVFTVHDLIPLEYDLKSFSKSHLFKKYKKFYNSFNKIIVHLDYIKTDIINIFDIKQEKIFVIPHGNYLNFRDFNKIYTKKEARELLEIPEDKFYILFFGYIRNYKGLDVLIKSLSHLPENICLLISGKIVDKYVLDLLNKDLKDRFYLFPEYIKINEISKFFNASDLACYPYKNIYQSGAIHTAFAFNTPVITSSLNAFTSIIIDSYNGYTFKTSDYKDLADKILKIYNNSSKLNEISKNAYNFAEKELNWNKIAKKTIEIYKK
ncbi:glycosyltransferase family 4 protein [Patescibacteria group bacterium]|nr:glycosyltransferase family 4 protein [Patescibacteria group bacterium]